MTCRCSRDKQFGDLIPLTFYVLIHRAAREEYSYIIIHDQYLPLALFYNNHVDSTAGVQGEEKIMMWEESQVWDLCNGT